MFTTYTRNIVQPIPNVSLQYLRNKMYDNHFNNNLFSISLNTTVI